MHRLILAALVALAILPATACTKADAIRTAGSVAAATADAAGVPAPATAANRTTLDEKAAIALEKAYTLSAKAASLAIRTGVVSSPSTIARIGDLNRKAYAAVVATRAAYRAGNATSYRRAFAEAMDAITAVNDLI